MPHTVSFIGKPLWGRLATCGRLSIGPDICNSRASAIPNRALDAILPHIERNSKLCLS